MSVTLMFGKAVFGMVADNGDLYYLLAVKSKGKKDEGNATWGPVAFGGLEAVMARVMEMSASCEGGDLQGPSGRVSPTTFLKQWREAFENVYKFDVEEVSARFGWSFEEKWREGINAIMRLNNLPEVTEEVTVNLKKHPQVLEAILQLKDDGPYPWSVGAYNFLSMPQFVEDKVFREILSVNVFKTKAVIPSLTLRKMTSYPEHEIFLIDEDGICKNLGWEYSTIGSLIKEHAYAAEVASPGSAEDAIAQIRAIVKAAPEFNNADMLRVKLPEDSGRHTRGEFDKIAAAAGMSSDSGSIEICIKDLCDKNLERSLRYMDTTFIGEIQSSQQFDLAV